MDEHDEDEAEAEAETHEKNGANSKEEGGQA